MFDGDSASVRAYLNEIGRYPLLSRAEEVQLAKRVEAGDEAARRRMTECNLRLVVTIARSYRSSSLELLDLVQEGTLGLMRAVERYDWRRDVKFSTYAAWWIRHGIVQAIGVSSNQIRIPDSVRERMVEVQRAERSLTEVVGRRPGVAEIADEAGLTAAKVLEARAARQPVGSLDAPVGDDGELKVADVLSDPNTPDPLQSVVEDTPAVDLEAELARLPERTRRIIELRYGLRDGDARTADAVAEELGVARERVRQIELHTLRKLGATLIPAAQAA